MVFAYHREQLRNLQEHLREGFARFDRGESTRSSSIT